MGGGRGAGRGGAGLHTSLTSRLWLRWLSRRPPRPRWFTPDLTDTTAAGSRSPHAAFICSGLVAPPMRRDLSPAGGAGRHCGGPVNGFHFHFHFIYSNRRDAYARKIKKTNKNTTSNFQKSLMENYLISPIDSLKSPLFFFFFLF